MDGRLHFSAAISHGARRYLLHISPRRISIFPIAREGLDRARMLRQPGYRPSTWLDQVETANQFARFEGRRLGRYWPFFHSAWPVLTFATLVFVKIIYLRSKAPRRKCPAVGLPTSVSNNKNQEL